MRDAVEVRHTLGEAAEKASASVHSSKATAEANAALATDPTLRRKAHALGAMIGVSLGFFTGGIAGMMAAGAIFLTLAPRVGQEILLPLVLAAAVFFGGSIGGSLLGGVVGGKRLAPMIARILERGRSRLERANPARRTRQPHDSNARFEEQKGACIIHLPPQGMRRAGGGFLFFWRLFWNAMILLITAVFVPASLAGQVEWNDGPETVSPVFTLVFLTPFWAIGLGVLSYLVYQGRRRAQIVVTGEELSIHEQTLTGTVSHVWRLGEIDSIRIDIDQSMSPPRRRLAITAPGRPATLPLGRRSFDELQWLAAELRGAASLEKPLAASKPAL